MRNRYLDEYVNGSFPIMDSKHAMRTKNIRDMKHEQPTITVIAGGPTLAGDFNRARKNYERYALTSKEIFFNLPVVKKVRVKQVPIMWTDDDEDGVLYPHEDALVIKVSVAGKEF